MRTYQFTFEKLEEMINWMIEMQIPEEYVKYTVFHEKPHFEKARELGYQAEYRIELNRDYAENLISYSGHVDVIFPQGRKNLKHIVEIASAPSHLSPEDIGLINHTRKILGEIK